MQQVSKILKDLQKVPSVPFLPKGQVKFLTNFLRENNYKYKIVNGYSLVVEIESSHTNPKLVIMAHTDHPGLVLKNAKEGLLMGSPGLGRLKKILASHAVPIRIYNEEGKYLGKGEITRLDRNNPRRAYINSRIKVPINSSAQYDFPYFQETNKKYKLYNADDSVAVAVMLALLKNKVKSKAFNLYFVFNFVEEVHQISSWHLAKNNTLNITESDFVINLECLKVENVYNSKYPKANYEDGVVIQLSNLGCLFGYKSEAANKSEILIKKVCEKNKIPHQVGLIKDSCDSRCFSYFNLTPNIITLTVPNKYKHSEREDGSIIPEEVYTKDVTNLYKILDKTIASPRIFIREELDNQNNKGLSMKIKESGDNITNLSLLERKAKLNNNLDIKYKNTIKSGYFFHNNIIDKLIYIFYRTIANIRYKI